MPKKILLADDSITIQKVVELTFSDADYEVTAVNNGAKAIAKLAEMRPDIILSDIIMPEKNGYEVCEYVKSHPEFRNIPVVLLTGTFEPFDPDRAEKAGCDAVVTKPFESQSLIQKVEELISQAAASAPAAAPEPEPPPAPSPWTADTEVVPLPTRSPFRTESGSFPTVDPFEHDSNVFNAPPPPMGTTEMPFDTPSAEEFSGETRAFTKMDFEAPPPPPPPAPEPSPWDEQPEAAFGSETRAFPKMTFDEMLAAEQSGVQESAPQGQLGNYPDEIIAKEVPPPEPEPEFAPESMMQAEPESESPFGAPPPAEEFSSATRAFPKLDFDAPPPPPPPAPEPSPWDEQPAVAFGGETQAFPKMTFDEMMAAQPAASEPSPWDDQPAPEAEPETMPWEAPSSEPAAWEAPMESAAPEPEVESEQVEEVSAVSFAAEEEATPFASSMAEEMPEEPYEVPPPAEEPAWAPAAEAEAQAEIEEPPLPSPVLAPETPSIPIAAARDLTDDQVDRIARRVVELMSDHVVRNIAWEVIPDLAEMVVKERIRQLESEA
jgi:CheY-like chemotaxis protein